MIMKQTSVHNNKRVQNEIRYKFQGKSNHGLKFIIRREEIKAKKREEETCVKSFVFNTPPSLSQVRVTETETYPGVHTAAWTSPQAEKRTAGNKVMWWIWYKLISKASPARLPSSPWPESTISPVQITWHHSLLQFILFFIRLHGIRRTSQKQTLAEIWVGWKRG